PASRDERWQNQRTRSRTTHWRETYYPCCRIHAARAWTIIIPAELDSGNRLALREDCIAKPSEEKTSDDPNCYRCFSRRCSPGRDQYGHGERSRRAQHNDAHFSTSTRMDAAEGRRNQLSSPQPWFDNLHFSP